MRTFCPTCHHPLVVDEGPVPDPGVPLSPSHVRCPGCRYVTARVMLRDGLCESCCKAVKARKRGSHATPPPDPDPPQLRVVSGRLG